MKITIDIDCTPQEAREFLGLPNVAPIQEAVMTEIQDKLRDYVQAATPEAVMQQWLPAGITGIEDLQRAFWTQFSGGTKPDSE
jgi:Tfp pilus assembly PilM family ATPase